MDKALLEYYTFNGSITSSKHVDYWTVYTENGESEWNPKTTSIYINLQEPREDGQRGRQVSIPVEDLLRLLREDGLL